eukprot:CAMPEP_0204602180 /NCGR_PEP_ID=MMETSP0661-20131031/56495_1 /ASSEMBLY_ACC=CAM_ASM_000606 /TAXON_ID=109239 /ORGANISM="Alexandrium margalefi, Strain AMGDE01CS-322" /LENGTH=126 /DNA_ID=CAMNT_0051613117 /DNA_START=337 /DNA_END=714 /DNA_ORIENTATION=-
MTKIRQSASFAASLSKLSASQVCVFSSSDVALSIAAVPRRPPRRQAAVHEGLEDLVRAAGCPGKRKTSCGSAAARASRSPRPAGQSARQAPASSTAAVTARMARCETTTERLATMAGIFTKVPAGS